MSSDDEVDPIDRATLTILHVQSTAWSEYATVTATEPHRRAAERLVSAGLLEAEGSIAFMQAGTATRLVVEGRWSGRTTEDQIRGFLTAVPEWFESGRLKAGVSFHPHTRRVRLTSVGVTAQGDVRSPERQHIVLRLLRHRCSEEGRLDVDAQRIERPLPTE